jgi:hypothetical protein
MFLGGTGKRLIRPFQLQTQLLKKGFPGDILINFINCSKNGLSGQILFSLHQLCRKRKSFFLPQSAQRAQRKYIDCQLVISVISVCSVVKF